MLMVTLRNLILCLEQVKVITTKSQILSDVDEKLWWMSRIKWKLDHPYRILIIADSELMRYST